MAAMAVYAIGGGSSGGKSTVARRLRDRHRFTELTHLDDLCVGGLEGPEHDWTAPAERLLSRLLVETASRHPVVRRELGRPRARQTRSLIEGEGIEPAVVAEFTTVRAVYVVEDDADHLWKTLAERPGGERFLALTRRERQGVVEMNREYGRWLRVEADRHGQPWVPARPWSDLGERILSRWLLDPDPLSRS